MADRDVSKSLYVTLFILLCHTVRRSCPAASYSIMLVEILQIAGIPL